MKLPPPATMARLQAIAAMKRDAELARLASVSRSRNALKSAIAALGATTPQLPAPGQAGAENPAMTRVRLQHCRWVEGRRILLNQRLARVSADWLALRHAAARAVGRVDTLEKLSQKTAREARRERE